MAGVEVYKSAPCHNSQHNKNGEKAHCSFMWFVDGGQKRICPCECHEGCDEDVRRYKEAGPEWSISWACMHDDHEKCLQWVADCQCNHHPEVREEEPMAKTKAKEESKPKVWEDVLGPEIVKLFERPRLFEWWLSTRPATEPRQDMSEQISLSHGSFDIMHLLARYILDRVSKPGNIDVFQYALSSVKVHYHHDPADGSSVAHVRLPEWVGDLIGAAAPFRHGEQPHYKVLKRVASFCDGFENQPQEEEER